MARRRMFSKEIVCTDKFYDLPPRAQALYFQMGMNADDDGFVSSPRSLLRLLEADKSELELLIDQGYILRYPDGVCLIADWLTNNQIRKDRYNETLFYEKMADLSVVGGRYFLPGD